MDKTNYTQEEYDKANSVNIVVLAKSMGLTLQNERNSRRIRVLEMDSMEIDATQNRFFRNSTQTGGGPVQFMETAQGISTVEAVHRLCGLEYASVSHQTSSGKQKEPIRKPFALPKRAPHHRHVFAYLNQERKIAPEIISEMMHQKRLYETVFSHNGRDYYNCVFVGMNGDTPVHAATRFARESDGKKPWRIIEGSDSLHPFIMEGKNNTLVVYESAIDAMSGATLDLMMGKDWRADHRIDLNGLSMKPLEQYLKEHATIHRVVLCTDNDFHSVQKGEENHGQVMADKMTEQLRSQRYAVERRIPQAKDVNEALKQYIALLAQKETEQSDRQEENEWTNEQ